jgi:hypothetical protein
LQQKIPLLLLLKYEKEVLQFRQVDITGDECWRRMWLLCFAAHD